MIHDNKKRVIVVLGMHRSGTSAITKGLELLGVGLGNDLHPVGSDNPTGFWEDRECLDINESLLRHLGSSYDQLDLAWKNIQGDLTVQHLKNRALQCVSERLEECGNVWGVKDPRMCRLLVFWTEVFSTLQCDVGVVIAVRNPLSVAESLLKRNATLSEKSYFLWLQHVLPSLGLVMQGDCRVVVDFDTFLEAPYAQLERMAKCLNLPSPNHESEAVKLFEMNFLDRSLRHSNFSEAALIQDQRASAIVKEAYNLVYRLARDQDSLEDDRVQREILDFNLRLQDMAPAFDYINFLEANGEALAAYEQLHTFADEYGWQDEPKLLSVIKELNHRLRENSEEFYINVLDRKSEIMALQVSQISALYQALADKNSAIELQAGEIHRLFKVLETKKKASETQRSEIHHLYKERTAKEEALKTQVSEIHRLYKVLETKEEALQTQVSEIHRVYKDLELKENAIDSLRQVIDRQSLRAIELQGYLEGRGANATAFEMNINDLHEKLRQIRLSRLYRLKQTWDLAPFGLMKFLKIAYLLVGGVLPVSIKRMFIPLLLKLRGVRVQSLDVERFPVVDDGKTHVLHIVANFFLGGSSRLVADIVAASSYLYHHKVLTSSKPDDAVYQDISLHVWSLGFDPELLNSFIDRYDPDLVHIHYWGDCDEPWYDAVYKLIKDRKCKIIENINTPVLPYVADAIDRYIYVSDYVKSEFGYNDGKSETVYPGSDFELFHRPLIEEVVDDCIGMVYRLENDKLNLDSICPFIDVVNKRPQTKAVIVGGGTNLQAYKDACEAAGVLEAFTFTDYVPYESLPNWYSKFSVFVAPVWKESFGQVSPFAMSMGLPVVGYNVGAISEIIGTDKLLADVGDSNQLSNIIVQLLDDREVRLEVGSYNQKRAAEKFSVETMTDAYQRIYAELLCGNG